MKPETVLTFWFSELEPPMWWKKTPSLDALIAERFGALHRQAVQNELFAWRGSAGGALAEVIVLDQFSRNIFRGRPEAFLYDPLAVALAQSAIEKKYDQALPPTERCFLYMPFMHSESPVIHAVAVRLFEQLGNPKNLDYELRHKAIIERFGRYPHRNEILGRESTEEELVFLKQPNSGF